MIKCLECGRSFIKPLAHVWQKHSMTAREYKYGHGLDLKKGIIPDEHRRILRDNVISTGTIENLKKGAEYRFKPGHSIKYERSEQTMARLKKHWRKVANLKGRAPTVEKIVISCAECGKDKAIYPRYYKPGNNFCGVVCRNIRNNKKRSAINENK